MKYSGSEKRLTMHPETPANPNSLPRHAEPRGGGPGGEPEDRILLPNGLTLWLPSRRMRGAAEYVVKEIFKQRRYYRPGFEIRPDDTVVDVGANMGAFVLWAATQAPRGRVVAVEPTSIIDCLNTNVSRNGLKNVTTVKAAVGGEGGDLRFVTYPGFNINSHQHGWRPAPVTRLLIKLRYGSNSIAPVQETARVTTLGRLMDDCGLERVNFLKVDCEGGEYAIFENLTARDLARVDRIAMEFHELQSSQRHERLVAILRENGFRLLVEKPWFQYHFMRFGALWAWRE